MTSLFLSVVAIPRLGLEPGRGRPSATVFRVAEPSRNFRSEHPLGRVDAVDAGVAQRFEQVAALAWRRAHPQPDERAGDVGAPERLARFGWIQPPPRAIGIRLRF